MEIAIAAGSSFLSASLQVLFEKLASFTLQERGSLHGIGGDNLQKLSNTVLKIRSIVAGVDERWLSKDPALSMWLRELKDVAYDAEDELDSFATELLKELIVDTCPKLKTCSLPLSEELRFLQIKGCPGVVNKSLFVMSLYPEGDADYPSEAELEIFRCSSNININSSDGNISSLHDCIVERLKLLSCFVIQGCPDVSSLHLENVLCHLEFLEEIEISSSRKMQGLKWLHESSKSLKVLRFQDCSDIVCLPRESLRCQSSLEKLLIEGCGELVSLEVQDLIMLETIIIQRCPKLTNMTFSSIFKSPLQVLSIDATSLLSTRLVQNLSSLQRVTIQKCSLVSFSKEEEAGLQCIPFLQHLELTDCPQLQYLPAELHKLWSLRSLSILCCPSVQALPSMGLPSSLQRLEITDCPKLIKRCEREIGPDWPLIAQIPFIKMYSEEAIKNQLL